MSNFKFVDGHVVPRDSGWVVEEERKPVYWIGEVPSKCQLSGKPLAKQFVDGRVPGRSSWAIMDRAYFRSIGGKLGTGNGQLYERQQTGRWLKIEG